MPLSSKLVLRNAYCSAPPLTSSLLPPRLSRAEEARRPSAPLRPVKQEVHESEADSVEFVVDEEDEQPVKVEPDPRQLIVGIAAIAIRQPASKPNSLLLHSLRP